MRLDASSPCPCRTGSDYDRCCGALHSHQRFATTAEELMRSRYSAFVAEDAPYLLETWHPSQRPAIIRFDERRRWLGLEVRSTTKGDMLDVEGWVEFIARFSVNGKVGAVEELSRFERLDHKWVYVDAAP